MKRLLLGIVIVALVQAGPVDAQTPDPKGIEFFERKIRPVLVEHCYRCHSEEAQTKKKLKASLFLDSRAGLRKGGDSGAIVVPGKAKDSLLLKALRFETLEMPPGGKLSAEVVADFARWIDLGAPDPREGKTVSAKREIDLDAGRQFWSFRPLASVVLPQIKNESMVKNPIDRFLLAKLEEKGLVQNPPATKEKLIRRAFYDVIGLPPTPEELDAFQKDAAPDAYERMVDRLLKNPHYGERWARHWLDVVRYAESGGYEFDGDRPGAYHYRDFVIRALNQDMPYDQFIRLQLAGDRLAPTDYLAGSATGFLVAGPYPGQTTSKTIERIRYDQLDDMLATLGSATLGMTLGCVRCHEHKYDPIPQQDYYRLLATLSRTNSTNLKLDPQPEIYRKVKAAHDQAHASLKATLEQFKKDEFPGRFAKWQQTELPKQPANPWLTLDLDSAAGKATLTKEQDGSVRAFGEIEPADVYTLVAHTFQKKITAIRLEALAEKTLPGGGPGLAKDGTFHLSQVQITAMPLDSKNVAKPVAVKLKAGQATIGKDKLPLSGVLDADPKTAWAGGSAAGMDSAAVFEVDGDLGFAQGTVLTVVLKFEGKGFAIGRPRLAISTAPAPVKLDGAAALQNPREIQALLDRHQGQLTEPIRGDVLRFYRRYDAKAEALSKAVEDHAKKEPQPNLATVFAAGPGGGDVFFLVRGEVDRKQAKAEPGFMQVLMKEKEERWLGKDKAGPAPVEPRLALANWMTDAQHGAGHLLARVIVNRLWKHHFGKGLVATPNDFGAQGERPSHPELLDWLAGELIKSNWQLKPLHRLIMTTAAYRQGNDVTPEYLKVDPENRLLWHRPPRRLEAEIIRDAFLHVSGTLDSTMYGPGTLDSNVPRRSIYLTVKRSQLIPFLQMFDAPEAIQSIGERSSTTVPTQALALMNSPFVRQRAEKFAQRIRAKEGEPAETTVNKAYQIALARLPTPVERDRMVAFLEQSVQSTGGAAPSREQALIEACQLLLCLNEFIYVD